MGTSPLSPASNMHGVKPNRKAKDWIMPFEGGGSSTSIYSYSSSSTSSSYSNSSSSSSSYSCSSSSSSSCSCSSLRGNLTLAQSSFDSYSSSSSSSGANFVATATTTTTRCWDEEYPKRQLLLRRCSSDRRSVWKNQQQRCAMEMKFGMTSIARMSRDRVEEEQAEQQRRRCAEEAELDIPNSRGGSMVKQRISSATVAATSPAASSVCSNDESIFSTNPHSSSFSSSSVSSVAKDEAATAATAAATEVGHSSNAFLDFNLVGGDLVAAATTVRDSGGGELEQEHDDDDGGATSSDDASDHSGDLVRAYSSSSSSSFEAGEHIRGNFRDIPRPGGGVYWHLLRSYKEIVGGERRQVARKLLRGCSPVGFYASPARLFVSARPAAAAAAVAQPEIAKPPSLRSKIAKATTETHDIYCRPTYKSIVQQQQQQRRRLPSFFRRRSEQGSDHRRPSDGSHSDVAVATTLRQAHLHCSLLGQAGQGVDDQSQRSYTFVVEGSEEVLVARPSNEDDRGFSFSFYSLKHRRPRLSRERSWRPASWSSSSKESEKVACMVRRGEGEIVLLDRRTTTPSPPRASFGFTSWDPASSTSWCPSPSRSKKRKPQSHCSSPIHSAGGGDMELLRHVWRDEVNDEGGEEIAAFVVGNNDMTAILPAGRHSVPPASSSSPSPLVHRWRSGGSCDCGGWDLGCGLNILHHGPRKSFKVDEEFEVAFEGPGKQTEAFSIKGMNNGLVSVSFQEPLVSAVQAFAAAVATITAANNTSLDYSQPAKLLSSAVTAAAAAGGPPDCFERL